MTVVSFQQQKTPTARPPCGQKERRVEKHGREPV